jgi:hypothetical protein
MNLYGACFAAVGALKERVQILRRASMVDSNGRTNPIIVYRPFRRAVVNPQDPSDIPREPGYELTHNTIEVETSFPIQGPLLGGLADQVVWHGNLYLVVNVRRYSKHGQGYSTAICEIVQDTADFRQPYRTVDPEAQDQQPHGHDRRAPISLPSPSFSLDTSALDGSDALGSMP